MADDPISFLERAVPIDTTEDVSELRSLLVTVLADAGVEATVDDAGNVLATRGSGDPHVVLNTHLDTVPPHLPYRRENGIIRGRGACDAKGPLAAMVAAFVRAEPAGRVTLAITPDEETDSTGAAALFGMLDEPASLDGVGGLDADCYIVGEPTGLDVCTAARGRFQAVVTITGENAHAASPGEGVNAVSAAAPVLEALETFDERPETLDERSEAFDERPETLDERSEAFDERPETLDERPETLDERSETPAEHHLLGKATLTPTTIEGGGATNQVPAECRIVLDRRSVPPETEAGFRDALEAHLQDATPDEVGVRVALTARETPFLSAFETPSESEVVRAMQAAGAGIVRPFGAATEASYVGTQAPTVVFGPGVLFDDDGSVAHADREFVPVEEVREAARIIEETVEKCRSNPAE